MFWKRIIYYLNPLNLLRRERADLNLRFMHGINKISVWMFLICLVVLLIKCLGRH